MRYTALKVNLMERQKANIVVNTPYDDVFRTLLNDCSELVIPVINEIFEERYRGDEQVVFSPNEHFLNRQDGEERKLITDSSFKIRGMEEKEYLFECQSTPDSSMLVRIFEYAAQIALDHGEITGNVLKVKIPHSAVLFLRSRRSTPDQMKIEIETPGGRVSFDVPVMKAAEYTLDEIFDKGLLFLIPFYIFSHEKHFKEYNKDAERLESLKGEYIEIVQRLEELAESGKISACTKTTIIGLTGKVLENIAKRYDNVREGVKAVMGGKVLEYEAKTILNEGRAEGRREGIREGILQTLSGLVRDGILTVADAASRAGLTEEVFVEEMQAYKG